MNDVYPDPAGPPDAAALVLRPHAHEPECLHRCLLAQETVWVDRYGNELALEAMSRDYLANVLEFLRLKAGELLALEFAASLELDEPATDIAIDDFLDPIGWLERTPLARSLARRLAQGDR